MHWLPKKALPQGLRDLPFNVVHDLKHDRPELLIVSCGHAGPRFAMPNFVPNSEQSINLSFVLGELVVRKTQPKEDLRSTTGFRLDSVSTKSSGIVTGRRLNSTDRSMNSRFERTDGVYRHRGGHA